jgi:hypothetical protein
MSAPSGFFALTRLMVRLRPQGPRADTMEIPSSDPREHNSREANWLGLLVVAFWVMLIDALLPTWLPWWWALPFAGAAAFLLLHALTIALAWLLDRTAVRSGRLSQKEARLWHTRAHLYGILALSILNVITGTPAGFLLQLITGIWVLAGIANAVAAIKEHAAP